MGVCVSAVGYDFDSQVFFSSSFLFKWVYVFLRLVSTFDTCTYSTISV